jgi:hypothetical protein
VTRVRASNFKSFHELDVRLDNLNVLIGANASGKSNLVQLFRFVRDIVESGLENAVSIQGGPQYLRNLNCGAEDQVTIELSLDHNVEDPPPFIRNDGASGVSRSRYRFSLAFRGPHLTVAEDELCLYLTTDSDTVTLKLVDWAYQTEGDTGGLIGPFWPKAPHDGRHPTLLLEHQGLRSLLPSLETLRSIGIYDIESKGPKTGVLFGALLSKTGQTCSKTR